MISSELRARRLLFGGALATFAGLLVAGTMDRTAGGALTVAGWSLALLGLHLYGRLGDARGAPTAHDAPGDRANS